MKKEEHKKAFLKKIESFKGEPEYEIMLQLKKMLLAKPNQEDNSQQKLKARSLMDCIIIMPKSYIKGWLRNEHSLSYREEDKRMLQAFLAGYTELQKEHMDMEIHKISINMLEQYLHDEYTVLKEEGDIRYVGKKIKQSDYEVS